LTKLVSLSEEGGFLFMSLLRQWLQFEFNLLLDTSELKSGGRQTGRKPLKSQVEPAAF